MRPATAITGGVDPDVTRDQARQILEQRRFQPSEIPRPFRGILDWLGDRLRPIGSFFEDVASSTLGRVALALALVAFVALVATAIARGPGRRAERSWDRPRHGSDPGRQRDPAELEREAEDAERSGDLETALRLRFRAGLLRLDGVGAIRLRRSLTSGQVSRRLHSPRFDDLAHTFDEVAYGRRPPSTADLRAARDSWPRVLEDAARK